MLQYVQLMDIVKNFAKRVKIIRLKRGLSQGKLAKKLKVNASYISQIERGLGNLSIRQMEKLAKALDVSVVDLLK